MLIINSLNTKEINSKIKQQRIRDILLTLWIISMHSQDTNLIDIKIFHRLNKDYFLIDS